MELTSMQVFEEEDGPREKFHTLSQTALVRKESMQSMQQSTSTTNTLAYDSAGERMSEHTLVSTEEMGALHQWVTGMVVSTTFHWGTDVGGREPLCMRSDTVSGSSMNSRDLTEMRTSTSSGETLKKVWNTISTRKQHLKLILLELHMISHP